MERNLDQPERTPRSNARGIRRATASRLAVRYAAQAGDLDACDRMIVVLAVHGRGGLTHGTLWLWDASSEALRCTATSVRPARGRSLERALERVQFRPPGSARFEADGGATNGAFAKLAHEAWRTNEAVVVPARGGTAQAGAAPLSWSGRRYGVLVGAWASPAPAAERLVTLRDLGSIAEAMLAAHARERDGRRARGRHAAFAELARSTISSQNLSEVLHAASRLAAQAIGAEGSAIWLGEGHGPPRLAVTFGLPTLRERDGRALQAVVEQVMTSGRPRWIERATDEPLLAPDAAAAMGAFAVCPIAAFGRALGAMAVHAPGASHPAEPLPFGRDEREFLCAVADLVACAADGAERHRVVREGEHRERELSAQLRHEARASSVAESAFRALQEARQPATSIRVFAARVLEEMDAADPSREYVEIVTREAERLERLLGEPVEPSMLEPPRLRMESINVVIQEALSRIGETLVRRRIRLLKRLASDVPKLLLDPGRMRQVVGGILHAATEDIGPGGRIRVESRRAGGHVVVEVAHDGSQGPGTALEQLFVPFAGTSPGRARVALGVASQVVREHGGEIRVSAQGEWTMVVSFTLPIRDNDDRRGSTGERRQGTRDRRKRS